MPGRAPAVLLRPSRAPAYSGDKSCNEQTASLLTLRTAQNNENLHRQLKESPLQIPHEHHCNAGHLMIAVQACPGPGTHGKGCAEEAHNEAGG